MKELSTDNLSEILQQNKDVIVQYGASWCGSCRMIKPKFKKLAEKTSNIEFVYVDAEAYPESRKLATVENLPTFAHFRDGQLVKQTTGGKIENVEELVNEATSH